MNSEEKHDVAISRSGGPGARWDKVRWSVEDLGGTNGTYVNMQRIQPNSPYALNPDDLVGWRKRNQIVGDDMAGRETAEMYLNVLLRLEWGRRRHSPPRSARSGRERSSRKRLSFTGEIFVGWPNVDDANIDCPQAASPRRLPRVQ